MPRHLARSSLTFATLSRRARGRCCCAISTPASPPSPVRKSSARSSTSVTTRRSRALPPPWAAPTADGRTASGRRRRRSRRNRCSRARRTFARSARAWPPRQSGAMTRRRTMPRLSRRSTRRSRRRTPRVPQPPRVLTSCGPSHSPTTITRGGRARGICGTTAAGGRYGRRTRASACLTGTRDANAAARSRRATLS